MAFGRSRDFQLGQGVSLGNARTEGQLLAVLDSLGIRIESVMETEIRVLCPLHGNSDTSAMSVSNPEGIFYCFNPMCDESGNLVDLVMKTAQCSYMEAVRRIQDADSGGSFQVSLKSKSEKPELIILNETVMEWQENLLNSPEAVEYLHSRGITDSSIEKFRLGYSLKQDLIITPIFDTDGACTGGVGRGVLQKVFKNIPGTQTSHSLYNIHNAKKHSTAIICESNFDAIRIHQAGFPGVVATLGGIFSDNHVDQVAYHFETIIIMTDVDGKKVNANCRKCAKLGNKYCIGHDPGRDLGEKIATKSLQAGVGVKWASYNGCGIIYPEGVKDAGDMTDRQIRDCIENSVSNFEYNTWK